MRIAALAFVLLAVSQTPVRADEAIGEPVRLVRTLQLLQDESAEGDAKADTARRALLTAIAARFAAMDAATWREPRNANAALLYVLSGGNPTVLSKLPASADPAADTLVRAVRAYAEGSGDDAKSLWSGIDVATLPRALVGPAALVKANLLLDADPATAMQLVDLARLESPGTLIEEAAIRRGIEIAAKLKDSARFEFLAVRYASRFPRSMYAAAFRRRFAESYLAVAGDDPAKPPELASILAPLAPADRRDFFLEVARLAVVESRMALARSAAENAGSLAEPGTLPMQRATLYRAAAVAMIDDPRDAMDALKTVSGDDMSPDDAKLLGAVRAVVADIERWPADAPAADPAPQEPTAMSNTAGAAAADLVARAEAVMKVADQSLAKASR